MFKGNLLRLGVNIDHIATLREVRKVSYPDPFESLTVLKKCSVDQVTIHLREDRRHIQDQDLRRIVQAKILPVNLEMAVTEEMVEVASRTPVQICTFVPEKRREVTTEGGLDVVKNKKKIAAAILKLKKKGCRVSLFIDPQEKQVRASWDIEADAVELHTGTYCDILEKIFEKEKKYNFTKREVKKEIIKIRQVATLASFLGLKVCAGHGLHRKNLHPLVEIPEIEEYNIGHAIIARAVFVGLKNAIREIRKVLRG